MLALDTILSTLTPEERLILKMRFGIGGAVHTVAEIAQGLGTACEGVRKIERNALRKLRGHRARATSAC